MPKSDRKHMPTRKDYQDILQGMEIWSPHFETMVVLQEDGKIRTSEGKILKPSLEDLDALNHDFYIQEYGTSSPREIMRREGF